jgi:hypothetical protein
MSGRELLVYRPDLFVDDEDVLDIAAFKQQMGESNGTNINTKQREQFPFLYLFLQYKHPVSQPTLLLFLSI